MTLIKVDSQPAPPKAYIGGMEEAQERVKLANKIGKRCAKLYREMLSAYGVKAGRTYEQCAFYKQFVRPSKPRQLKIGEVYEETARPMIGNVIRDYAISRTRRNRNLGANWGRAWIACNAYVPVTNAQLESPRAEESEAPVFVPVF